MRGKGPKYNVLRSDWVIMSATGWISGKPTIDKIIKENNCKGTIIVCERDDKKVFILGAQGNYGNVGEVKSYTRDTGNGYRGGGSCRIENIITISEDAVISSVNDIGLNEKRYLYVYK